MHDLIMSIVTAVVATLCASFALIVTAAISFIIRSNSKDEEIEEHVWIGKNREYADEITDVYSIERFEDDTILIRRNKR